MADEVLDGGLPVLSKKEISLYNNKLTLYKQFVVIDNSM